MTASLLFILIFFFPLLALGYAVRLKLKADEKYRELVQYSNSIILMMDRGGKVTFLNKFAQDFFGFSEGEIIGKSVIGTIVPKTDTTGRDLEEMIGDVIASSEKYKINVNENMKKTGERVWIIWTNKSVPAGGRRREILCIGNDMTGIKEAEDKLNEAMEMKNNFVSMVSHEIRSPLAAIKGNIDVVADGLAGPLTEQQKYWIDSARNYIARLTRVADDILVVQKFDSGKMVFEMKEDDLKAVISDVAAMMRNVASQKGLELATDVERGIPALIFDRDRVIQVLVNLINNAVKFTDKGHIRVSAGRDKDFVRVSVSDTGCGIPAGEMPRVFEKFGQLSNARARKAGGTGLGLAIAREIVLRHGGDIWVESEPGRGTTFSFKLPLGASRNSGRIP